MSTTTAARRPFPCRHAAVVACAQRPFTDPTAHGAPAVLVIDHQATPDLLDFAGSLAAELPAHACKTVAEAIRAGSDARSRIALMLIRRESAAEAVGAVREVRACMACAHVPVAMVMPEAAATAQLAHDALAAGATEVVPWPPTLATSRARCRNLIALAVASLVRAHGANSVWAQASASPPASAGPLAVSQALTPRELACLHWTARGKTAAEVGLILHISTRMVNRHVQNVLQKMNCANKQQAVAAAVRHGWLA